MGYKKNRETFIEEAKKIHGDKYDYSLVEYINTKTKVKIICQEHGIFEQTPDKHIYSNQGCKNCKNWAKTNNLKHKNNIIDRFIEKHGDKYDYSLVDYINNKTKVKIICTTHGEFEQNPNNHLQGNGCPKCGGTKKYSDDEFINKVRIIHGDKYDYSKVDINHNKIIIICKEHGEFLQTVNKHINSKQGCPKCSDKFKLNDNTFIEKGIIIHGDKYDYSKVNYVNNKTKVIIICPIHGKFEQRPSDHLSGHGCNKCVDKYCDIITFIEKAKLIHGDKYDYSKVNYVNAKTKVTIICPSHGEFEQVPNNHLQGKGCLTCGESKGERTIREYLNKYNINFKPQHKFDNCKNVLPLPFDFYLPELNMCIEYNGRQHYESVDYFGGDETLKKQIINDNIKLNYCDNNNIILNIIKYDDNINDKLKNIINGK